MITLDSIIENIIVEIVVGILSFIASIFLPKIMRRDKDEKAIVKYDPLNIAIMLESFAFINFILNISFWNNSNLTVFLAFSLIILGALIIFIYNEQCPSCKKFIGAKKRIDRKDIKFTRDWKYQPKKIWLYSNWRVWKEKPIGKEKTRTEHWVTRQDFYECNYCGYKWDSGQHDINLDIETRPKNEIIKTREKDPNEPY